MANADDFPGGVPRGMKYEDRGSELEFSWAWRRPRDMFLTVFAVVWNAITFGLLASGAFPLFMVLHVIAGLGIGYGALRQMLNRTAVTIRPGELVAESGPIGPTKDVRIQPFDLRQLYVRSVTDGSVNGKPTVVYELHAIVRDRREDLRLVGNLPTFEQAAFIEQRVEQYLEITDQPVPGSLSRQTGQRISGQVRRTSDPVAEPNPPRPQDSSDELRDALQPNRGDRMPNGRNDNPIINPHLD